MAFAKLGGVYRRRFRNGMALVNPRGNGNRTVTIEPGYRRFLGNQDRGVNNGNPATSIMLQDRDAIVLKPNAAKERCCTHSLVYMSSTITPFHGLCIPPFGGAFSYVAGCIGPRSTPP